MTPVHDNNVMLDDHIHDIPARLVMNVITPDKYQSVKQQVVNLFYWYTIC
jgi:hypothetical protein